MAKLIALSLVLLITAPLAAQADETSTGQQEVLRDREARLQAELVAGGKIGGERRDQIVRERRQIQDLITRLETGKTVDPKEIDRVLGTYRPGYIGQQEALEQREARLQYELTAGGKLGGLEREQIARERREIQGLISRLESGAKVDPKEIDRLVGTQGPIGFQSPRATPFNVPPKQR